MNLNDDLRNLLKSYAEPCVGNCEHSQCPLLRELHALRIKATLEQARLTVKPIVDRERESEQVGSLMDMRLRSPVAATVNDGNDLVSSAAAPPMRELYDAACRAGLRSAKGRTFEQWQECVSDYGLDSARTALRREKAYGVPSDTAVNEAAWEIVTQIETEREPHPEWSPKARAKYVAMAVEIITKHLHATPSITAPVGTRDQFDLDPCEFWRDLAEVLGHPRPEKVNPVSLIVEVEERLRATPSTSEVIRAASEAVLDYCDMDEKYNTAGIVAILSRYFTNNNIAAAIRKKD